MMMMIRFPILILLRATSPTADADTESKVVVVVAAVVVSSVLKFFVECE